MHFFPSLMVEIIFLSCPWELREGSIDLSPLSNKQNLFLQDHGRKIRSKRCSEKKKK